MNKTSRLLGLFFAAALAAAAAGCGQTQNEHVHVDNDRDGYCDFDGQPMNRGAGYAGSRYWHGGGTSMHPTSSSGSVSSGPSTGITSGSSGAKGGIGSHGVSGGG